MKGRPMFKEKKYQKKTKEVPAIDRDEDRFTSEMEEVLKAMEVTE